MENFTFDFDDVFLITRKHLLEDTTTLHRYIVKVKYKTNNMEVWADTLDIDNGQYREDELIWVYSLMKGKKLNNEIWDKLDHLRQVFHKSMQTLIDNAIQTTGE